jgi:AcrR family transcriptional regulator
LQERPEPTIEAPAARPGCLTPAAGMPSTEMEPLVRERLLEAALTQLAREGREAMSTEALLAAAEVSEADFAADYRDLDACLDDAYERLTIQLDAAVQVGCSTGGGLPVRREIPWPERVRGGLEALLAELADRPEVAATLTGGYPALGPARQARYQGFLERLVAALRVRRETAGVDGDLPGEVDSLAIGAAEAIVFEEIAQGRTRELPAMVPSILFSLLVPFLGPAGAAEEMQRADGRGR